MRKLTSIISVLILVPLGSAVAVDKGSFAPTIVHETELGKQSLDAQNQGAVYLRAEIYELERENEALRNSVSQLRAATNASDSANNNDSTITSLASENKRLQNALNRVLTQKNGSDGIQILQSKIEKLEIKNKDLKAKVSKQASGNISSDSMGIKALKDQNQSLRDTISAQNEALRSADGSGKKNKKLLSENISMQQKLKKAEKDSQTSILLAKELFVRNKLLQSDIAKRDKYIKANQDKRKAPNIAAGGYSNDDRRGSMRGGQDRDYQDRAYNDQGRARSNDDISKYRAKIRDYQNKINNIEDDRSAYQRGEEEFSVDKDSDDSEDDGMVSLLLENQELKARLKLLSKR